MSVLDPGLAILREEWRSLRAAGWGLLRSIPSTSLRCFLDYFDELPTDRKDELAALAPHFGLCLIRGVPAAETGVSESQQALYMRHVEQVTQRKLLGTKYLSLRMLKTSATAHLKYGAFLPMSDAEVESIRAVESAKAAHLRKLLRASLPDQLGLRLARTDRADFRFEGDGFAVSFDFGGLDSQLRYWVEDDFRGRRRRLSLESALGLIGFCPSDGGWNFIPADLAETTVLLVGEAIERVLALRKRVDQAQRPAG